MLPRDSWNNNAEQVVKVFAIPRDCVEYFNNSHCERWNDRRRVPNLAETPRTDSSAPLSATVRYRWTCASSEGQAGSASRDSGGFTRHPELGLFGVKLTKNAQAADVGVPAGTVPAVELPILSDIASQRAPPPSGLGHSTVWRRHGLLDRHSSDPTLSPLYRDLLAHYGAVALSGRVR